MNRRLFSIPLFAVCALAGCLVRTSTRLGPVGPVAPAPDQPAELAAGGPIEAGCSFNAAEIKRDMGDTVQILCPAGCASTGATWGSEVYTADSTICRAAIHAGATPASGGMVTVHLEPGRPAYRGSSRHGVDSSDYGSYRASYRFLGVPAAAPDPVAQAPQIIEAGCSFNAAQIHGEMGSEHRVSCPAGCSTTGGIWGTDVYTADTGICHAAVHAGVVSDQGGEVTVILEPGRPAYRGSLRNGVQSSDYGSYRSSFRFHR